MAKFYFDDEEVPSLEGTVENAIGKPYAELLELKVDTFGGPVFISMAHGLRLNKGERVRLYSCLGFDHLCNEWGGPIQLSALEILNERGESLYQYMVIAGKFGSAP